MLNSHRFLFFDEKMRIKKKSRGTHSVHLVDWYKKSLLGDKLDRDGKQIREIRATLK